MMRISTKGRYGARLMLDLAVHYEDGYVFLKDVSRREEISEKYLEHLIPPLEQEELAGHLQCPVHAGFHRHL
jgi:DNA-binding IscR family transcriptional regulator